VWSWRAAARIAAVASFCASAGAAVDPGAATVPRMEFTPLRAGTYTLEKIQPVTEATLLNPSGVPTRLSSLTTSKITLLTFFYTYCADPLGCPFAYHTLTDIRGRLLKDAALAKQVRFVGISFDPTNDTPEAIGRYRDSLAAQSDFEWQVLTAKSVPELLPVLDDFGQDVSVEFGANGKANRTMHHMLKVFLIDGRGTVREIYTLAFLHPEVIVNDIRTLYMEQMGRVSESAEGKTARKGTGKIRG
jgi:cytochrome oxidase Cu insertion factor (SCO1/SenC/PrrC family)